jgi:hypothetical protein
MKKLALGTADLDAKAELAVTRTAP